MQSYCPEIFLDSFHPGPMIISKKQVVKYSTGGTNGFETPKWPLLFGKAGVLRLQMGLMWSLSTTLNIDTDMMNTLFPL